MCFSIMVIYTLTYVYEMEIWYFTNRYFTFCKMFLTCEVRAVQRLKAWTLGLAWSESVCISFPLFPGCLLQTLRGLPGTER